MLLMNKKNSNTKLSFIFSSIEKTLPYISNKIACFDADGTLWKEDVDSCFLEYQKTKNLLPNLPSIMNQKKSQQPSSYNPQQHIKNCSLLAQRHKGVSLNQFQSWCQDYFNTNPLTVFPFQRKLLSFLKSHKITLYVLSASSELLVKSAVRYYQLPIDEIIGVKTLIKDGIITSQLQYPLSVGSGKVSAFLQKSPTTYPFFVSGNTLSDLSLLKLSTHFKFVVASACRQDRQYFMERQLLSIAQKNSWLYKDLLTHSKN